MKTFHSATVLTALMACSIQLSTAAPKLKDQPPSVQARAILERVDLLSADMAMTADKLALRAKDLDQENQQLDGLSALRDDVNKIGRDLQTLESEQESLPGWQSQTVAQILPLMQEIARNTEKALESFASARSHMWATDFPEESAKIDQDAARVKATLDDNLSLASLRDREQNIAARLSTN